MHWNNTAIVLSAKKHGENSAIVRVFAASHGVFAGVIKGIHSKTNRGTIQLGNIVNAAWKARLAEHLGTYKCELLEANAAHLMQDAMKLSALTSVCTLIESALPERHPYPKLYEALRVFLDTLRHSENWQEEYVKLELSLLAEAGFGLDLSRCAATGTSENLIYVSPKSGRAVSAEAGEPYREKLLPLPAFFLPHNKKNRAEPAEILAGMQLTGYFLDHWLLTPHHRKLPAARERLIENMKEYYGAEA